MTRPVFIANGEKVGYNDPKMTRRRADMKQILVLGGGAAGIVAAIAAAEQAHGRARVILLERNPRIGKKLLATGNGRCNLDNNDIRLEDYFTSDRETLGQMLDAIGQRGVTNWFADHGLLSQPDEVGRVYPYSNQAADVLNLLLYWLEKLGVQVRTDCTVTAVEPGKVTLDGEEVLNADAMICAFGGSAGPQFGTDGSGVLMLRQFGCKATALYPCLVPLKCKKSQIAGLSGIRVKCDASLYDGEKLIHRESGEVQFTDYGLSGIAVMQLSGHLGQQRKLRKGHIRIDLFPGFEKREDLTMYLKKRLQALPGASVEEYMTGLLNKRVASALWRTLELGEMSRKADSLTAQEWDELAFGLKNWSFSELEDTGWKNAQTTGGGVRLSYLDPESFELKACPGVYIVGESLDCAGACGGFNLHFAFGSGILAGKHAVKRVLEE